ncbi:hypothetical protein C8A00DRAFT_40189 [Chaetomidium leptoderma]|uniref:Uncharacterized protein n=1 Tax=Chaetomidium leptoderma TaxID=669021 RepID=A0AAN7A0E8_9PEZI|nr:hypothetical protein C8A00DRAFT_40189 [Chaetomidium leptoderma]
MPQEIQALPIRSQMTRVVPRQEHAMLTPGEKNFPCTPRQRPLLLACDERVLAQIAAFGPLRYISPAYLKQRIAASGYFAAPSLHVLLRRQSATMSFDWTHQFCLGCDKQTEGATYCSESCRLADYDKTSPSTPSSAASSPALSSPPLDWNLSRPTTTANTKFYVSPAYDFGLAQLSTRRGSAQSYQTLSPSASHTSLCSIRSHSSAGLDAAQLTEKAARELRAYARSFESVRLQQRRRSSH